MSKILSLQTNPGVGASRSVACVKIPALFDSRRHVRVARLLEKGANPLSLCKDTPLFWYGAFAPGGVCYLEHSGLTSTQLAKPALMRNGTRRTLLEQVATPYPTTREFFGLGHGGGTLDWVRMACLPRPDRQPGDRPTYEDIAACLLRLANALPAPELLVRLRQQDLPLVHQILNGIELAAAVGPVSSRAAVVRI